MHKGRPTSAHRETQSSRRSPITARFVAAVTLRRRPRAPLAVLGSAARKAQVSEVRREGADRRREERERMAGREEDVGWGSG